MSNFDDELNGYIQARSESSVKEKAREQFEATLATLPYPHPENFSPTPDAPVFAQNPSTQMWHDGSTGTFSYYDVASGTYIPVEGADSPYPQLHHDNTTTYNTELYEYPDQQYPETGANTYEAPPESDATLRLCVLSSKVLKLGGVIMVDGSGISFGRDKPLSGQGKRVRMVEMEVSRFHANIYLDRQQAQRETYHNIHPAEGSAASETGISSSTDSPHLPIDAVTLAEHSSIPGDNEEEQGAIAESPLTRQSSTPPNQPPEPSATRKIDSYLNEDHEDGEILDFPGSSEKETADVNQAMETPLSVSVKSEEELYREYQEQMEQYQQYYQQQQGSMPTFVDTFQIIDCGSTHGTLLNGQRLSTAKTASQPFTLKHLDQLQLGSTVFEVHVHEEGRICASCQVKDDNEITVLDDKERERDSAEAASKNKGFIGDLKLNMELERVEEMNRLRKKWGGPSNSNNKRSGKNSVFQDSNQSGSSPNSDHQRDYVDRAAKRRQQNPDDSRPVPTSGYPSLYEPVTGFHVPVAASNKGHAMLSKMGWKAGTGLGAARQGVVEPVQLLVANNKAGVGSGNLQHQGVAAARKPETQAEVARRKARERYSQL
ncbi:Angiogenic factor with G patch and FHA domains 1 [Podila minutissima]|uniref:Angiogenic factor with G patch and FHA domains 1 n=1 Tax=Podila minutissima TaxID=64525 RepID=A0A9P5SPM7_9FUNG|nr:Angiogenic factor with G patch and FHA domains 1 [Podila minutissima]